MSEITRTVTDLGFDAGDIDTIGLANYLEDIMDGADLRSLNAQTARQIVGRFDITL